MRKFTATALTAMLVTGLSFGALAQGMSSSPSDQSTSPPSSSSGTMTPATPNDSMSPSSSSDTMKHPVASASEAKSSLEAQGYTRVESVKKSGTDWTATAMKDGKSVHVAVDQHGNVETR